ncbi:MAG: MFS transporter [Pseudomonadota bacterium]|nr:MAG: MFS transporter [Pseudomonadota bacterium]
MSKRSQFPLVLVLPLKIAISMGTRHGMGLFLEPVTSALGVDRETFSLTVAWQNLIHALPVFGILADLLGFRRIALLGGVVYGAGLWLASHSETALGLYTYLGGVVGIGIGLSGMIVVMGAVGQVAPPERRSTAFGLVTVAFSIGMFIMAPLLQYLINLHGWSGALQVAGGLVLIISLLALGLPGNSSKTEKSTDREAESELTLLKTINGAMNHHGYLLLNVGFFVCGFHVAFIGTHLPSFLQAEGISISTASWALAMIGLFNMFGSMIFGRMGDSLSKKNLLSLLYTLRAVVIAGFLAIPLNEITAIAFGAAIGSFGWPQYPSQAALWHKYLGPGTSQPSGQLFFSATSLGPFLGSGLEAECTMQPAPTPQSGWLPSRSDCLRG